MRFHHAGALMQLHFPALILMALLVIQFENIQLFVGFGQSFGAEFRPDGCRNPG
jgi:hypothetical protein